MKRRRVLGDPPPERLVVFTEADWPGQTRNERVTAWCEARKSWYRVNGWPGGFVVLLREHGQVRRGPRVGVHENSSVRDCDLELSFKETSCQE